VDANALLVREWQHTLESEHKSRKTITSYTESVRALAVFLNGAELLTVTTDDLRRFIAKLIATRSASTAATRYRCLQQFYAWAVRDKLIDTSPMATMRPPTVPETPVPVVPVEDLRKLLKACEGRDFLDLRDTALIRLMLEPGGMRRAEIAGLSVDSIDLENDVAVVMGKGRRPRAIPYGHKTGQALTRYLRVRMGHPARSSTRTRCGCRRRAR
jgi:site-specific recombinase XerD